MSEDLLDEVTSLSSIYGPSTLVPLSDDIAPSDEDSQPHIYSLTFPSLPSISLRVEFSRKYPDVPPSILGTQSVGDDAAKGDGAYLVELVREVLGDVYVPGAPVVFDLVEEVGTRLQQLGLSRSGEGEAEAQAAPSETNGQLDAHHANDSSDSRAYRQQDASPNTAEQSGAAGPPPPWILSDSVTEKKSVFVARAARVASISNAQNYLQHLLSTDKRVARATHNITAWRIRGANGVSYQDCDDDGESAAGGRVLKLLEMMGVWDCMVVVSRWYGGILLGGDRFRLINAVAREAVVRGGFLEDEGQQEGDGQGGKGRGKGKKK